MTELLTFDLSNKGRQRNPKILLDSGPPRALYKVNPRLIFGKKWWDETRRIVYDSYNNTCAACGKHNTRLEAHELYNVNTKTGKVVLIDIVPLCFDCHSFIHQDLHRALLRSGDLKYSDVTRILKHGKDLLRASKIRYVKKDPNDSKIKHEDWRLVLNGVEYPPVFESRYS